MATEIARLYARIGANTTEFDRGMRGVDRRLGGLSSAFATFTRVGLGAAVLGIGAFATGLRSSIASAKEFDQVMSGAAAVLGITGEEMRALNDLALQLGKDTAFSAAEAAGAIEMLAKNGLTAEEILSGAADATVKLAAATSADLATSADIATDAMATFGLSVDDVQRAIDGISGVVVTSKFDIQDYALALAQGGGVASAAGVSFEDFNTAVSAISSSFASGSDAGTSIKVMLQRLVPASNKAEEAMRDLGIVTEEGVNQFFNADGSMRSMAEIAGVLQDAFSGLSDQQRTAALSTIFGTDSMRAAAKMAEIGQEEFLELADTIGEVDASIQAATRLDNLAGDMEELSGSFETLKIKIGQAFTPFSRAIVQSMTGAMNELLELDYQGMADGLMRITSQLQQTFVIELPIIMGQWANFATDFETNKERIKIALDALFGVNGSGGAFGDAAGSAKNSLSSITGDLFNFVTEISDLFATLLEIVAVVKTGAERGESPMAIMRNMWDIMRAYNQRHPLFAVDPNHPLWRWTENGAAGGGAGGAGGFGGTDGVGGGGVRGFGKSSSATNNNIVVNVPADAIPADRDKVQKLARAIWREAELAGLRV